MSARPSNQDAISVSEAAELTGASSKSLRRRIERGTLGSIRQGGRRLIPVSELIRVGLLDASGQGRGATAPVYSAVGGVTGSASSPGVQDAAAAAWASAAPSGPAPAGAPLAAPSAAGTSPVAAESAAPASPAASPPPAAVSAGAMPASGASVPGPRPQASAPRVRTPWSGAADQPRTQGYSSAVADQAPPAAPAGRPPAPSPGSARSGGDGLSPQESRRLAAMVELVMHQMRTINALNARLSRLEARLDELAGSGG